MTTLHQRPADVVNDPGGHSVARTHRRNTVRSTTLRQTDICLSTKILISVINNRLHMQTIAPVELEADYNPTPS